jgi:hypothetical protein
MPLGRSSRDASIFDLCGLSAEEQSNQSEPGFLSDFVQGFYLVSLLALALVGSAAASLTIAAS